MTDSFDLETVEKMIRTIIEELGMRLYDINYNEVSQTLRVFIDREKPAITVKDCKKVNTLIFKELESLEFSSSNITLEVSSPGIQRPLKRHEHFVWALGKHVEVDVGDKKIKGYLRKAQKEGVVVGTESGETFISYDSIVKAGVVEELLYDKRR